MMPLAVMFPLMRMIVFEKEIFEAAIGRESYRRNAETGETALESVPSGERS